MTKEPKGIEIALRAIKTEQFATFEENFNLEIEAEVTAKVDFKLNSTNKQLGVFLGFSYKQENKDVIKFLVSCHFLISNNSWSALINEDSSTITFPRDFLAHISAVTVGTARGILYTKTEGTPVSGFIIPLLNMSETVTNNVEFELTKK